MATNTGTNGTHKAPKMVCGIVITEADAKKVDIETVLAEADAFEAEMVAAEKAEKAEKAAYAAAH